jgi:hypothetical protein
MSVTVRLLASLLMAPLGAAAQTPIRDFDVGVVEELGRQIYRRDMAAAVATDIMLEQRLTLEDYPLRGWVVTEDGSELLVTFIGEYDGELKAVFDVRPEARGNRRFALAEQRPLSSEEAAQFRARTTAEGEIKDPCSERYNSVVLKDPEREGWIVYWLASTTRAGVMVIGGHYRVMVSADAQRVVAADRLSASCMAMELPSGQDTAAAVVTHVVSATPVETHVFVSLQYRKPLYVITGEETFWLVDDGSIEKVDRSVR